MTKLNEFPPGQEQTFVSHLVELRDRLLRAVIAVVIVFLCLFYFTNDLFAYLARPMIQNLVPGTTMIATGVVAPFLTPFKFTLALSVFISIPYVLYEAWGFVAPALYSREKRLVFPLVVSGTFLFYLGMAFAYFVVFPLVFKFLAGQAPEGVSVTPDITYYLDFALKMFFAFGLAFEVPIATVLLIWSGISTAEDLARNRPYVIVGAFIVGMLLTPPDVLSQTFLAIPMWLLFEVGLVMSRFYTRSPSQQDDPQTVAAGADGASVVDGEQEPHYSEAGEQHRDLSDDEMEAELDRMEAEEAELEKNAWRDHDNLDQEEHPEFEPIEEERIRAAEERNDGDDADNDSDAKVDSANKDDDEPKPEKT